MGRITFGGVGWFLGCWKPKDQTQRKAQADVLLHRLHRLRYALPGW
jgi:hypothetical protein